MKIVNHYTYITEWNKEDDCFITRVLEFPSLSAFGETRSEAEAELDIVLTEALTWMKDENEKIPEPISHKEFKGNISLRIPPETHRNVAIMALNEGISLNQYLTSLIERNATGDAIAYVVDSFENKLKVYYELFQKITLTNYSIYHKISRITNLQQSPQEEIQQNRSSYFISDTVKEERPLII